MFILMTQKFHQHKSWIMPILVVGTIVTLIGFFTPSFSSSAAKANNPDLPTIQGKPVDANEFQQAENFIRGEYAVQGQKERGGQEFRDRLKQDAVVHLLLARKARDLGIRVSNDEVEAQIRALPQLQNQGRFDPDEYRKVLIYLQQRGVSPAMFEEVIRSQLLHMKLQQLVTAGIEATPIEVQQEYLPLHEKLSIDLVTFKAADYANPVPISNEVVRAFYDQHQDYFRTPPEVKVRYAVFPFAEAAKSVKFTDDQINDYYERNKMKFVGTNNLPQPLEAVKSEIETQLMPILAQGAAQDRARELTVKLAPADAAPISPTNPKPDFDKLCADLGAKVHETGYFGANDKTTGLEPAVVSAAQSLDPTIPFSDAIPGTNAYFVLEYLDSKPAGIPAFEEVKDKATEIVKRLLTYDATVKQGRATVELVKKLMGNGKTFEQACDDLKLKYTTPPPFTVSEEKLNLPGGANIQQLALAMAVGATSDFISVPPLGGVFFHLHARKPADLDEFEKDKTLFAKQVTQRDRQGVFNDWLQTLVRQENVDFHIKQHKTSTDDTESPDAAN